MSVKNLLYKRSYQINDKVSILIPSVGEVVDSGDYYAGLVSFLVAMPIDMMVELDDMGIDFTKLNSYDLFILMFSVIKEMDTSLVFGDLDLSKYQVSLTEDYSSWVCVNGEDGSVIGRDTHAEIVDVLRKINGIEPDTRTPGNEETRKYLIERARKKKRRARNQKGEDSQLEQLIVAMANAPEFHYGFEGIRELSIYQFNESVQQVIKRVEFDNRMIGVYAGTINAKEINQKDLNWLTHK